MLAFRWDPRWVRVRVSISGIEIETCVDRTTGLILCPICSDPDEVCPEGTTESRRIPSRATYFFTFEDLIRHMKAHTLTPWERKRISVALEEEEGEGEEVEERLF